MKKTTALIFIAMVFLAVAVAERNLFPTPTQKCSYDVHLLSLSEWRFDSEPIMLIADGTDGHSTSASRGWSADLGFFRIEKWDQ